MHKINGMSEFHDNLYENIDKLEDCDSIKKYIQKYDEYYLDACFLNVTHILDFADVVRLPEILMGKISEYGIVIKEKSALQDIKNSFCKNKRKR